MVEEKYPIQIGREIYFKERLLSDIEKDYKCLSIHYQIIDELCKEDRSLQNITLILKAMANINIIHDRIRKRLNV